MLTSLPQLALWVLLTAGPPGCVEMCPQPPCDPLRPVVFLPWTTTLVREWDGLESGWRAMAPNPTTFAARCSWLRKTQTELPEVYLGVHTDAGVVGSIVLGDDPTMDRRADDIWLGVFFNGKASSQLEGFWGSFKTQLEVESVQPAEKRDAERWQTEEALQVPITGPLYVFGQVQAGYNTCTAQQMALSGRTGVGCKLKPIAGGEIILTGCSALSRTEDPLRPVRLPQAQSQVLLELQCNYAVFGPVKVEYQGTATPALDPLERNRVQQDLRFAIPLGEAGQIRLGAKHQWEDLTVARPWLDGMQLYLGVGLKR